MESNSEICLRVWVEKNDRPYIGPGRVRLLEEIVKHGSISKAAIQLKMSYRKAWQLINDMNTLSKTILVEKKVGGKTGGGAVVTETGKRLISDYRKIQNEVDLVLAKYSSGVSF